MTAQDKLKTRKVRAGWYTVAVVDFDARVASDFKLEEHYIDISKCKDSGDWIVSERHDHKLSTWNGLHNYFEKLVDAKIFAKALFEFRKNGGEYPDPHKHRMAAWERG